MAQPITVYTGQIWTGVADDADTILTKVREWTSRLEPGEWLISGIIGSGVLPSLNNVEFLELLDAASNGHPVLLRDDTMHNRQVNSTRTMALLTPYKCKHSSHDPNFRGELSGTLEDLVASLRRCAELGLGAKLSMPPKSSAKTLTAAPQCRCPYVFY